ncbi:MAG: RtcB family protein [Planctomycetes bacterium]|nr:RtcB family protein [Planctomycetota bacterium]
MMRSPSTVTPRTWLVAPLAADVRRSIDRLAGSADVRQVAVMPDVHRSGDVCVGVAVATSGLVYPAAVGGDIGCGMAALRFDAAADILAAEATAIEILRGFRGAVPALKRRRADAEGGPDPERLSAAPLARAARRDGAWQLGTLGRGNHFLELQADQERCLWLMVHSGSRGIGRAIDAWHHRTAVPVDDGGLAALDATTAAGRAYLDDVAWAREWSRANRACIARAAAEILRAVCGATAEWGTLVDCDHNHVRAESHDGVDLLVHRKGALSARAGERGLVPGSMGTASFHTVGRGSAAALESSSHGAGRALPRGTAAERIDAGRLVREMHGVWFDARRAGQLRDEAPSAYKDIRAVMRAQRELTAVERELRPVLSYKAT